MDTSDRPRPYPRGRQILSYVGSYTLFTYIFDWLVLDVIEQLELQ